MFAKIGGEQEGFAAVGTAVGFAVGVDLLVLAQSRFVEETLAADVADVRPRLGMLLFVLLQVCKLCKLLVAGFTDVRAQRHNFGNGGLGGVNRVKVFVGLNFFPGTKCSITVSTGELRESCVGSEA